MPKYFSQNGEDYLLWNLFDYKRTGFYVDVGAFDGVHLSNSYSFEQEGWTGICIEPHPTYFQLCKQSRPRSICIQAACVADQDVGYVEFCAEELGLLSGLRDDRENDVRARYEGRGLEFSGFDKVTVPALTLTEILAEHVPSGMEIDFISIDVEGTEIEVLKGLDFHQFQPLVLVIEANSEKARTSLSNYLARFDYYEARQVVENVFYSNNPKLTRKLRKVVIDCEIERSIHPLGEQYTARPYRKRRRVQIGSQPSSTPTGRRVLNRLFALFDR